MHVIEIDGIWVRNPSLVDCAKPTPTGPGDHAIVLTYLEENRVGHLYANLHVEEGHTYQILFEAPMLTVPPHVTIKIVDAASGVVVLQPTDARIGVVENGTDTASEIATYEDVALCAGKGKPDAELIASACTAIIQLTRDGALAAWALRSRASAYMQMNDYVAASSDDGKASGIQPIKGDPYLNAMRDIVCSHLVYPSGANGASGVAVFKIVLSKSGSLKALELLKSSGAPVLDSAIEKAIRASAFKPLPEGFSDPTTVTAEIPLAPKK
nr:hypothetical protein DBT41_15460 [Aerococcus urinae]